MVSFKKRTGSRSTTKRPKSSTAVIAKKALRKVEKLEHDIELKYYLNTLEQTSLVGNTWYQFLLNNLTQGDTASDREGNQATIMNFKLRMRFTTPSSTNTLGQNFRVLVLQDKQCPGTGSIPSMANILLNSTDFFSSYNYPAVVGRWRVLHDKIYKCDPNAMNYNPGIVSGSPQTLGKDVYHTISFTQRHFSREVRWYDASGTDTMKNPLYVMVCSDNTIASSDARFDLVMAFHDS